VPSLDKPAYKLCQHSSSSGCGIYSSRPQECRDYSCLWLSSDLGEVTDRPDEIGIVFDKPTLVSDHADYQGVPFVCAREIHVGARNRARAAELLVLFARTWVVRVTDPSGRTQLTGPRHLIELLLTRAKERAEKTGDGSPRRGV
jgi:hypothetical protein